MPVTIQPTTLKYKDSNGQFISADCLKGDPVDVLVNGTSVVENGVANIPIATTSIPGAVKVVDSYGILISNQSYANPDVLMINKATDAQIQAGNYNYRPIVTSNQHSATFYGLAKAAGDATQSASANAVGEYTDEAKIAIQKMLGIYEAPWELIKEDTITNTTEASIDVTTDNDGHPFELTDIIIQIAVTPIDDVGGSVSDFGRIYFRNDSTNKLTAYCCGSQSMTITQQNICSAKVTQRDGLCQIEYSEYSGTNNHVNKKITNAIINGVTQPYTLEQIIFDNIKFGQLKGTVQYRVFGKRKWE